MTPQKVERKCRMKPFVKYVNYNHLLPTRFLVKEDFEFRSSATEDKMNTKEGRDALKTDLKKQFQER